MDEKNRIVKFKEYLPFLSEDVVRELQYEGFFKAPASTIHHGNYEGGLFDHSYEVAKTLVELTEKNNLIWQRPKSPMIIGMFHDLCKIDAYIRISEGRTLSGTTIYGEYEHNNNTMYEGHGDKSVMILSTLMQLTPEEVACIRYHMGAFTDKSEWKYYTRAVKQFPNVLWTHHADMIASQIVGI